MANEVFTVTPGASTTERATDDERAAHRAAETIYSSTGKGLHFGPFKPNPKYFDSSSGHPVGTWSPVYGYQNYSQKKLDELAEARAPKPPPAPIAPPTPPPPASTLPPEQGPPPAVPPTGTTQSTGLNSAVDLPKPKTATDLMKSPYDQPEDTEHKVTIQIGTQNSAIPNQTPTGTQLSKGINTMAQPTPSQIGGPGGMAAPAVMPSVTPTGTQYQMQSGAPPMPPVPPGVQQNTAIDPAPGPFSPWGNNPKQVTGPTFGPIDPSTGRPGQANNTGQFAAPYINEKNQYGGQQIAGANPSQADYGSVQGYADKALEQANRYIDPQQAQQNRRMQQELINKGVDPNSPQGAEMQKMLAMQQGDQRNSAAFGAMQFGQGIQNQMAQQEQQKANLAGQMQQGLWNNQLGASGQNLQKYGMDQNFALGNAGLQNQMGIANMNNLLQSQLGNAGLQNQKYGMEMNNQLGLGQLDMNRAGQEFNQMMGMEGMDFRNQQFNFGQQQYQDQLMMSLMGMTPIPGVAQISPGGAYNAGLSSAGQDKGILGALLG